MDYPATFNVLIDAKKIFDGGIGVSLRNLIEGLIKLPDIKVSLLGTKEKFKNFDWKDEVSLIEDNSKPYSFSESFLLSKKLIFQSSTFFMFRIIRFLLI